MMIPRLYPVTGAGFPPGLLKLEYLSPLDQTPDWALLRPPDAGCRTFIVFLHGLNGNGNQLFLRRNLRQALLPAMLDTGYGLLSPTLRHNAWMNPAATADLDALLDYLRQDFQARRFLFDSGSMGATGSLIYAAQRPHNVHAVVARGTVGDLEDYYRFCHSRQTLEPVLRDVVTSLELAYGGSPQQVPDLYRSLSPICQLAGLRSIPLILLHGTCDQLMPVQQSRRLVGALSGHQALCYEEIPGGDHELPLELDTLASGVPIYRFLRNLLEGED